MEEIVEKLFKELQKSLEKIRVQTIGRVNAQKAYTNQQKAQLKVLKKQSLQLSKPWKVP